LQQLDEFIASAEGSVLLGFPANYRIETRVNVSSSWSKTSLLSVVRMHGSELTGLPTGRCSDGGEKGSATRSYATFLPQV